MLVSLSPAEKAMLGALASMLANLLVYPLDLAKTIIQTQPKENKQYRNTIDVFRKVLAEKGPAGLYHGVWLNLAGCGMQNFGYFYWYTIVRRVYDQLVQRRAQAGGKVPANLTAVELLLGMVAAAISNLFTLPVGVVSTKQQTDKQQKPIAQVLKDMYADDGITGFWAGLKVSTILCVNPSITYGVFERLRSVLFENRKVLKPWELFVAGMISKTCATIATQPLIVSKALLQKKSDSKDVEKQETSNMPAKFHTYNEALVYLYTKEGVRGLWKGVLPQLAKGVVVQGLLFTFKDQLDLVFVQLIKATRKV